jgi:hypothetical protein
MSNTDIPVTVVARLHVEAYDYEPTPLVPEGVTSDAGYDEWLAEVIRAREAQQKGKVDE